MIRRWAINRIADMFHYDRTTLLPWWLVVLRFILFPINSVFLTNSVASYNAREDTFTLYFYSYPAEFFRMVSHLKKDEGVLIRKDNGGGLKCARMRVKEEENA